MVSPQDADMGPQSGAVPLSIAVSPPTSTIDIVNGDLSNASVSFTAVGTYDDGSTSSITDCSWTLQNVALGVMSKATFTASGDAGGPGKVVCTSNGVSGSAVINIMLHLTDNSAGFNTATTSALTGATAADPDVTGLLFPYDGTVFPRGLDAPEMMWTGGGSQDLYAVYVSEPGMEYTYFFNATTPERHSIPHAAWTQLVQTTQGGQATVKLFRMKGGAGGSPYLMVTHHWTLSTANLRGSIFYWRASSLDMSAAGSGIVKIKPGQMPNTMFLQPTQTNRCIACHSVSRDGSTIAVSFDGNGSPWGTFDAATGAQIYSSTENSGFQAISPDGSLVVWGMSNNWSLQLADSKTGAAYEPSGLSSAVTYGAFPSFSSAGKKLTMVVPTGSGTFDSTYTFSIMKNTNIAVVDFDPMTKLFSNKQTIKTGSGEANVYPNFSPDDKWVIYQSGTSSSARPQGVAWDTYSRANIRMVGVDGTGDMALDKLNSAGLQTIDLQYNFEPTFNPVAAGGYFWAVFVSMRTYGNRLTITTDENQSPASPHCTSDGYSDCRGKQLWVAAIDGTPHAGTDPSHPAFWLEGQDLASQNMRGAWALDQCKAVGDTCEAGFECCQGACRQPDGAEIMTGKTCAMPQPGQCSEEDGTCAASADCCNGLICLGDTCQQVIN